MTKSIVFGFLIAMAAHAQPAGKAAATLTGWFSDEACAAARLTAATLTGTNPECSRKCIEQGKAAVFIDETGRRILKVKGYASAKEDLGYHVEISGEVDDPAKTISVQTVKKLSYDGAACSRPKKTK